MGFTIRIETDETFNVDKFRTILKELEEQAYILATGFNRTLFDANENKIGRLWWDGQRDFGWFDKTVAGNAIPKR
jgi:hypothetical protein